jgi:hypothetical protein
MTSMMTTDLESQENQRTVIERLLEAEQVLVHINPRFSGTDLPAHLAENRSVTLRLSRFFRGALFTDADGISAELLFGSSYFTCVLPWGAIWGASSMEGDEYIWSDAAPEQILELYLAEKARSSSKPAMTPPPPPATPSRRPPAARERKNTGTHLRRVK